MERKFIDIHVIEGFGYYVMERSDGVFYIESDEGVKLGYVVPRDAEMLALNLSVGYDLLGSLRNGWSFEGIYNLNQKEVAK